MARIIIRKAEVVRRTGLSATTIWRLERDGEFPPRVRLTEHSVGWPEVEVERWIADRVAGGGRVPPRGGKAA